MTENPQTWCLLVVSLPTSGATARMRLWRAVKALGCASLRDGAYLLPCTNSLPAELANLAAQTNGEAGQAWVVDVTARSAADQAAFQALFSRAEEHAALAETLTKARKELASQSPSDIAKALKRLRKEREIIRRIDFFPDDASLAADAAWADFEDAANSVLSLGEPVPEARAISPLKKEDYQARIWATRRNLWVDRVASAWLIQRFIDRQARFVWLDTPASCPEHALGFDFDGAAFTHVGDKVTFEVLLATFNLDGDSSLAKLAALVHALDVGGTVPAEAAGFEAILAGARARHNGDDDALLADISAVLDSLYTHFNKERTS
ncbi:chromate resistance protein ChrB domain-containing protein [Noviherbaspirillum denitrificans]|uniref:Chromate resistance protein n=1 Tax=Noviherbaspirillum denitrificans TaxID=1968433 RepID=A0A254TC22_9BURK|nr:chromate resistance protein ChrB domain-containing protein [Noviherbaspirillum denitrificans]OWW20180.1 hypothetical protein AYR66_12410 [Noviherbaspirillum denitrificans]